MVIRQLSLPRSSTAVVKSTGFTWMIPITLFSIALAFGGGLWMHLLHEWQGGHERYEITSLMHWLRDSSLALPAMLLAVGLGMLIHRRLSIHLAGRLSRILLVGILGISATLVFTAGVPVHAALFGAETDHSGIETGLTEAHGHAEQEDLHQSGLPDTVKHALSDGLTVLPVALGVSLLVTLLMGASLVQAGRDRVIPLQKMSGSPASPGRLAYKIVTVLALSGLVPVSTISLAGSLPALAAFLGPQKYCAPDNTVFADVVALDQQIIYNRLGAFNPAGMMYALRRDVVVAADVLDANGNIQFTAGTPLSALTTADAATLIGNVMLRGDKRPRPLTLRVNRDDCLAIQFQNLLNPIPAGEQPADRHVGIHVNGLHVVDVIESDGSNVGQNPAPSGLVEPGGLITYKLHAEFENTYLMYNMGVTAGAEATGGTTPFGLFGAVNVQPPLSEWYRSQLTRVEMDLATSSEAFTDANGNGVWDAAIPAEPLVDANNNGMWDAAIPAEPLVDANNNGIWDAAVPEEAFVDANGNNTWDPDEAFTDANGNGQWDAAVPAEAFTDSNGNGTWDAEIPAETFTDTNGNRVWDAAVPAEQFVDINGNGAWDAFAVTLGGQPILNYDAIYPAGTGAGKDGLPIINMRAPKAGYLGEIVHSDLNAIITGPNRGPLILDDFQTVKNSTVYPDRAEPFREFTVIFHDDAFAVQAFPQFADPVLRHTLAGVADAFPINYGSGGIGSEIIANRLGVGPMWDCTDCKYEEFFLTSWVVGDPAMVVDIPANAVDPVTGALIAGPKATKVLYPDDPSNVHHSYLSDHVRIRNLHAGPLEHHIFHLHAHQWTFNPNDLNSSYLDSQGVGPGSGYTYEIAYGGSGNRNKTPGDSIFHCHFYPHFAQGMWSLWRVHDTFEQGTNVDEATGVVIGGRALPDGEITSGTPIPGIVPLPAQPMAPMPDPAATIVGYDLSGDGVPDSSQFDVDGNGVADFTESWAAAPAINPGYPFYIPGVMGHRPPTPALDIINDGGLPRHVISSGPLDFGVDLAGNPLAVAQYQTRLDFNKILHEVSAVEVPENGTPAEQVAMNFHSQQSWPTYLPDGSPGWFETNGLKPVRGAPFADPCRADGGLPIDPDANGIPTIDRVYKGVNIQMDVTLNKVGWHFPQQRFITLWEDALPTLNGIRPPEPLVMRLNSGDCAEYLHTNLVPNVYELDDYQVRTPTDIIGQHIHLVKFDVIASDGSANGFNYEDGTLSPDEVRERIAAINAGGGLATATGPRTDLVATAHPFFGATGPGGQNWLGARTTVQRWYADPILDRLGWDQGLGSVFTHDHYGPSTHQQVGLYATVLIEPAGSSWRDPESPNPNNPIFFGTRHDGGPTSWRADILTANLVDSYREFYMEFTDFQHAYQAGVATVPATTNNEAGVIIPSYAHDGAGNPLFDRAIAPSFRVPPPVPHNLFRPEDIYFLPPTCPGPILGPFPPRPCPEAISASDPGTYTVNYRNEPLALRVFEDANLNGVLDPGEDLNGNGKLDQVIGDAGDLALAFQSRTDRVIPQLNTQTLPALTNDVKAGDPATPLLRVYMGDKVRIRVQQGGHEEEHNFTMHGVKWLQESYSPDSGWRNSQFMGISEYFNLQVPIIPDTGAGNPASIDYLYTMGAQIEGYWNGIWGLMRSYSKERTDLLELPNNDMGKNGVQIVNDLDSDPTNDFNELCPVSAPVRTFQVTAVRAADILGPQGLVYNTRPTGPLAIDLALGGVAGQGPLIDPTALMYVQNIDLTYDPVTGKPNGLKPGIQPEPLSLRAVAGDCIQIELTNALPALPLTDALGNQIGFTAQPDLPGFNTLPPTVKKAGDFVNGFVSFNTNDMAPSSYVGLHPQLLSYNVRSADGFVAGNNSTNLLVPPGGTNTYLWYAGDIAVINQGVVPNGKNREFAQYQLVPTPVEYGVVGLMPADRIKGSNKGLVGALVIEPAGATWVEDPGTHLSATVSHTVMDQAMNLKEIRFRDFVTIFQDDVNLRYGGLVDVVTVDPLGGVTTIDCTNPVAFDCAVHNIAGEGAGIPEDAQDSGQKAVNYGAEPIWYRLGLAPDIPFENALLRGNTNIYQVFSNAIAGNTDPQTSVFYASGSAQARLRLVQPGGQGRAHLFTLHGHAWQRSPYINGSTAIGDDFETMGTTHANHNMSTWWLGGQEGVGPGSHFDILLPRAGGINGVPGDYLFRDQGSFGSYQGLWGVMRVVANLAPNAAVDTYTTPEETTLVISAPGVLGNDLDVEMDALSAQLDGGPANGVLSCQGNPNQICADGSFSYTPNAAFNGIDSFTYKACDAQGACSVAAVVSITVTAVNDAPVAVNDAYTTLEDTALVESTAGVLGNGVLANDSDVDALSLTAILVTGPAHGSLVLNADGSFTYTPALNYAGPDSFTYQASDGALTSNIATVAITVDPVNDPPVAMDDAVTTNPRQPVTISILANDTDVDGNLLGVSGAPGTLTSAAGFPVSLNADGTVTYTPGDVCIDPLDPVTCSAFSGVDSFSYQATDGSLLSNIATVTITVNPNLPPTAGNDSYITISPNTLNVSAPGVLGNDGDPDGDPLTLSLVSGTARGTLTLNANGSFSYTPTAGLYGPDSFTYRISDGRGGEAQATVTITVNDRVTVTKADYSTSKRRWNIQGTGSAGATITIRKNGTAGPVIATVTVPSNGSWSFNGTSPFGTTAVAGDTLTASSNRGGSATRSINVTR